MKLSHKQCYFKTALLISAVAILCFFGVLKAGFFSDDFVLVHRIATEGYYSSWGGEENSTFFRPLTTFTYLTDFHLWGNNPTGFHLTNILWHLLSSSAVFLLFLYLFMKVPLEKPCLYALFSSVFFLSLTSHSESVSWVSGRTDVIATSFCLLSLFFFLPSIE